MQRFRFRVSERIGCVSALLREPPQPRLIYVLAHGAGAGMEHPFLEAVAEGLAGHQIATLRYQFPYMEAGRRRPDPPVVLRATVRAAVTAAAQALPGLPRIAGGKSMGGRMTSQAAACFDLQEVGGVLGLAFLGFPLHPPGKPDRERGEHLKEVSIPMLFLQGPRDSLADLDLLTALCQELGRDATLHIVEGGDHSFKVLKRSGRSSEEVMEEIVSTLSRWAEGLAGVA